MIEGIDTVHVQDNALRRTATQLKDNCEVKGTIDKLPRMPSMAAHLAVTLRLGGGTSIVVQSYRKDIAECEDKVVMALTRMGTLELLNDDGALYDGSPHATRITDITNALREQE